MLFLSHSGADSAAAKELARRLREAGLEVWLDLDDLLPGARWMTAIEEALQRARAFAVYVGSSGIQRWVDREVRVALELNTANPDFRIIPILGAGAADPETLPYFLRQHQAVDFRREISSKELKRLIGAILEREPEAVSLLPPGTPPFRGLEYFDVEHAHLFFGRDEETQTLLEKLHADRFLAVVGASGSGKSSLVRAGLIPALHHGRFRNGDTWPAPWKIAICRPGGDPFTELANALPDLDPGLSRADRIEIIGKCKEHLKQGADGLRTCLGALVAPGERTLLLVDQFEELFTSTGAPEVRRHFIDSLLEVTDAVGDRPVHVLITLRADFYSRCWEHPELPGRITRNQHAARPLTREQLQEVMEKPLALAGAGFEPGLVETLLKEAGSEPGSLPLLQHALLQLWERREGNRLTHRAHQKIGGVCGALAHHAEEVFSRLDEDGRLIAQKIFQRLTQTGAGTEDTRRRASREEIVALGEDDHVSEQVLARLTDANARLVVTRREGEHNVVEVAHEALIREWPRLRRWIEENRDAIRIERRLIEAAAEWERVERNAGALFRGPLLTEAEIWARDRDHWEDLLPQEQEFLQESINARDQAEREAEERRRQAEEQRQRELEMARQLAEVERQGAESARQSARRNKRLAGILAGVTLVAFLAAGLAVAARARAEANFELARNAVDESLALADHDTHHFAQLGLYNPQVEELRRELLHRAQPFYRDFIQQRPGSRAVREGLAYAHLRLGHIHRSLGEADAAIGEYGEAIARFEELVEAHRGHTLYRQALADAYNWLGEMLRQASGRLEEARHAYDRALAIQQELHRGTPEVLEHRRDLARTHYNRGIVHYAATDTDTAAFARAEADFREAIALLEPLAAPDTLPRTLQYLGRAYNNLGVLLELDERRLAEAQGSFEQAIATHERLVRIESENRAYQFELMKFYNNSAHVLHERGELDRATQRNRQALDVMEELAHPAPRLGIDLADAHNVRGRLLEPQGLSAALQEYRLSLELLRRLATDRHAWSLPEFHERFGDLLVNLAALAREHPQTDGVRRLLSDASESYLALAQRVAASGAPADAQNVLATFEHLLPVLSPRDRESIDPAIQGVRPRLQERASGRARSGS